MASKYQDEQEKLREKRELLKLKQGLIEESDVVEDYEISHNYEKPVGKKGIENFFYHYKWHVIAAAVIAFFVGFMVIDTITKEKEDLYILAISTTNASRIYTKQVDIEEALERYCPDFDGNGYVHVGINFINISDENAMLDYANTESMKFTAELHTGDSQMYITDTGMLEKIAEIAKSDDIQFFLDLSEEYPDAVLYEGQGLQLNTTGFADQARWTDCPDIVGLYIRGDFVDMTGNKNNIAEQRSRAKIVFDNIVNGNIVNPAKKD